jgi:DNA polymerase III subunit gamma/tau
LAVEMVLVRLAYAADLPPPSELVRRLADGSATEGIERRAPPPDGAPAPGAAAPEAPVAPKSFAEAVAVFERFREPMLHGWLYQAVQLVHFEPGRIELRLAAGTPPDLPGRVAAALGRWTGRPWLVSLAGAGEPAAPTLAEQALTARRQRLETLAEDPRIKPVLERFPGAAIVDVRPAASR